MKSADMQCIMVDISSGDASSTCSFTGLPALLADRPEEQVVKVCDDENAVENLSMTWSRLHPIGAGLKNAGNTCFLNATVQCLTYTAPLVNFLLSGDHYRTCHDTSLCMICTMTNHIDDVFCNSGRAIKPVGILSKLKRIAKHFKRGKQEDASEFLGYLMEAMHESCIQRPDQQMEESTVINKIFGGHLRSRVSCLGCRCTSDTFEPYRDIALPIQSATTLTRALEDFVKPEQLEFRCSKCMKMGQASKTATIHSSANVLTIALKRFNSDGSKITKQVKYPEHLEMRPYMSDSEGKPEYYSLYAVLVHLGNSSYSGHYYCYIKASNGQWYKMNDSAVRVSNRDTVLNQQAYMLFYIRSTDNIQPNGDTNPRDFTQYVLEPKMCGLKYSSPSFLESQSRKRCRSDELSTSEENRAKRHKMHNKRKNELKEKHRKSENSSPHHTFKLMKKEPRLDKAIPFYI